VVDRVCLDPSIYVIVPSITINKPRLAKTGEMSNLETLIQLLRSATIDLSSEKRAQADVEQVFITTGVAFEREVHLSPVDIPDFMSEGIAIEIKVQGKKKAIYRQLCRYAKHPAVNTLVLASNLSMGLPPLIEGKDAYFVKLGEAWL